MRTISVAALLAGFICGLIGCGDLVKERPEQGGGSRVEAADPPFGGVTLVTDRAGRIERGRPELSISCGGEFGPSIHFSLVRAPRRPPPLRGVHATLQIDDGAPETFEMAWAMDSNWMLRTEHPNQDGGVASTEARRLAREIAGGRMIRLSGLDDYAETPVTWTIELPDDERARILQECQRDERD